MKDRDSLDAMRAYGRFAGLGVQFVASMCLLGFVGYWLDGKLGTYPWLLIVGIFLGAAGSFYSLLLAVQRMAPTPRQPSSSERTDEE